MQSEDHMIQTNNTLLFGCKCLAVCVMSGLFGCITSELSAAGASATSVLIVTAEPANSGTVIGSGTYPTGTVVTIQAVAAQNYIFSRWQGAVVNPSALQTKTYASGSQQRVIAVFEPLRHLVDVKIEPSGAGSVNGAGFQEAGQVASLLAEPAPGYAFDRWDGPVTRKDAASTQLARPLGGSVTLTAHFKPALGNYKLVITANPAEGGKVTGAGTYERGKTVRVKAEPARGYIFNGWAGPVALAGSNETTVYIGADTALTAKFMLNRSQVKAGVMPEGAGRVIGGNGLFPVDIPVEVVAEPAKGYRFVRWDGPVANASSVRTTIMPIAGRKTEVTAVFSNNK